MKLDESVVPESSVSSEAVAASVSPLSSDNDSIPQVAPSHLESTPPVPVVMGPPNDENTNHILCEKVFLNGFDSCQGCDNSHDFDPVKLARGACVYELRRKDSCNKKDSCLYCHQIPSKCRNDKQLLAQAYEKKNAARRKDNSDNTDSREICPTEFYGGTNTY